MAKDLDYFSQMLDDLMEEKESLQQKYEEEKVRTGDLYRNNIDLIDSTIGKEQDS